MIQLLCPFLIRFFLLSKPFENEMTNELKFIQETNRKRYENEKKTVGMTEGKHQKRYGGKKERKRY